MLAIQRALQRMHAVGITRKRQVLDNETIMAYRQEVTATGMTYQLVPPDDHRRNIAEKTIQTWKDHFIAVWSGVSTNFPMHLLCRLIPQAEKQLLLLRQSNVKPKFQLLVTSTDRITITRNHSSPLAWKPWYTINRHEEKPLHNTAAKDLWLARPQRITYAGTCGLQVKKQQECQAYIF